MAKDKTDKDETVVAPPAPGQPKKPSTVRMERYVGGPPSEADVHPDEVENWKRSGWHVKG